MSLYLNVCFLREWTAFTESIFSSLICSSTFYLHYAPPMAIMTKVTLTPVVTTDITDGKEKHLFSHFLVSDPTIYCDCRTHSPKQCYWLPWHQPSSGFSSYLIGRWLLSFIDFSLKCYFCPVLYTLPRWTHNFNQQLLCLCLQTGFLGHWYY